ncbi:hypothetical protein [Marixanthomonas ophiurae]|uniref:Uncharacterized protein n=1 Tax=Marixanthomonas ophiurae TaxID=387659 RepID=A0A3E1Q810_9FLAO|nr:hypothetical protein [Marixanthomonas ophiurae]RFN58266.1 hypothetical protein DZ858_13655 [Marixanthomonas ophiurae]
MNKSKIISSSYFYIGILIIILVGLELFAADLAYENYGWAESAILFIMILLNAIPIILLYFKKRLISLIILLGLGIIIIPNQLIVAKKLILLKEEAANIVNFAYLKKLKTGNFPDTISDYKFVNPKLKEHFDYSRFIDNSNEDNFQVTYYVGTTHTSHFYTHNNGPNWYYYDD